ncbi:hypothetical protein FRC04_004134 [Tulasnella sp. 424]|nr:hypothetical protein FRC04_004134 [Tulasnella sp. 424]
MPFVVPYIHRWRTLWLNSRGFDISKYINEPAPMLRRLRITEASFTSDIVAFGGVTSVDLAHVTIAADLCFLKNLKELRLSRITYKFGDATVNKLGDILNACPEL